MDSDETFDLLRRVKLLEMQAGEYTRSMPITSGTWTATFSCTTSGTITITSTVNTGQYVKVGRAVFVSARFTVASVSSPVGIPVIVGLPFTVASIGACSVYASGLTAGATTAIMGNFEAATTWIGLYTYNAGSAGVTLAANFQAGTDIRVGGVYMAAA